MVRPFLLTIYILSGVDLAECCLERVTRMQLLHTSIIVTAMMEGQQYMMEFYYIYL